jgi:hypothetical protein
MPRMYSQEEVRAMAGIRREPATSLDVDVIHRERKRGELLHSIVLPINLSNDNGGRSQHWSKANKRKKECLQALADGLHYRTKHFPNGVTLMITRILGKGQKLWDADSVLRGSAKEIIDSLVQSGWFYDDGPEYISGVSGNQDETRRSEGPAVQITVFR